MKRKIIAVLLTATMCFSIAACGKDDSRRDRDDEEEEETQVVETEETTVATTTAETRERETVATTETSVEDNALTYNPEDVNYVGENIESPLIPESIWDAAYSYVCQVRSDAGLTNPSDCTPVPVFWYPETDKPIAIPYTAEWFTADNQIYEDSFFWFSEDWVGTNVIFCTPEEICLIVGTDPDTLPTLSSIYESTDGSQTLDEVIASNENIIVPTFVDRDDTAHIDAELAQAVPGAQITNYNAYGRPDYSVASEYDLFQGPGIYYIRMYVKSETGEWHVTYDTPRAIVVVDPVEAGLLTSYN